MGLMQLALPDGRTYGLLAEFETPASVYAACEKIRDEGFTKWDAHTPFPVHGLDRAMGLKPSKLPWIVLVLGFGGALTGWALQTWIHTEGYALNISGKPLYAWPAYMPVIFELGVLGGAAGAVFGMLGLNKLPSLFHPLFRSRIFERVSDDRFFISIESWDPKFDLDETREFLLSLGATQVETVENED